ncbi:CRISPR-associated endonuclease Cas1, subtype II/NMENI [Macrococcoides caseolyticum]|uniref:type II CRISPR-associated endonuclease Cas1 n=1 Tax=Macrococcoides caseolyticum TaxID=69966 RepID=UPI000E013BC7|nr:type II CRISPR-associated endonuclease Cas1 [Macrococcus caseolyticus]STY74882.1 CRISPR-associated endonuclease Cas1, subtype II/NMENI [Macrococcus caseolyticus]
MSFRTIVITKESKLSLRMNHLVVKSETHTQVPIGEISCLIIENPNISITGHLMNALTENKIMTIVCGKDHLPQTFLHAVYGHHRQSRLIEYQMNWKTEYKECLWQMIVQKKINHQKQVLQHYFRTLDLSMFDEYIQNTKTGDFTNREGHAAKVYFNIVFSNEITRDTEHVKNAGLDYGYQILLAIFARTIISKGYLTEIGIKHRNEFNLYNLASDLMEVIRPLIDYIVLNTITDVFEKEEKRKIADILNKKICVNNKMYYLVNAIEIYVESVFKYLSTGNEKYIKFPSWKY